MSPRGVHRRGQDKDPELRKLADELGRSTDPAVLPASEARAKGAFAGFKAAKKLLGGDGKKGGKK